MASLDKITCLIEEINELFFAHPPSKLPWLRHPDEDHLNLFGSFQTDEGYPGYYVENASDDRRGFMVEDSIETYASLSLLCPER